MNLKWGKISWMLFLAALLASCNGKKYSIQELNQLEIIPPNDNYRLELDFKGRLLCKTTFEILMDDSVILTREFNGQLDSTLMIDWYENKLAFNVYPMDCAGDDVRVKVKLCN